jgi:hypothetical protein
MQRDGGIYYVRTNRLENLRPRGRVQRKIIRMVKGGSAGP